MKLAAITGSIGCGKTTLSKIVRRLGYVVYDIDGWVRRLYYQKDFIKVIAAHFPEVMEGEKVNKRKLRNLVFGDNARLKVLESLIHPFLKQTLMNVRRRNARRADLFLWMLPCCSKWVGINTAIISWWLMLIMRRKK